MTKQTSLGTIASLSRRDFFASSNGDTDMGNSHGRFVWYVLMTTDMEAATAFYTALAQIQAGERIKGVALDHDDYGQSSHPVQKRKSLHKNRFTTNSGVAPPDST
jgi:hypothetical protein